MREALKGVLAAHEGRKASMYVDTAHKVTIGVGHMLPNVQAAEVLAFLVIGSGRKASKEAIWDEYYECQRLPQRPAQLFLADESLDALIASDICVVETGLSGYFGGDWNDFPEQAQVAMLDMAFNLGLRGLLSGFPKLRESAIHFNWAVCAAECERNGIGESRNAWTRRMFQEAANANRT